MKNSKRLLKNTLEIGDFVMDKYIVECDLCLFEDKTGAPVFYQIIIQDLKNKTIKGHICAKCWGGPIILQKIIDKVRAQA